MNRATNPLTALKQAVIACTTGVRSGRHRHILIAVKLRWLNLLGSSPLAQRHSAISTRRATERSFSWSREESYRNNVCGCLLGVWVGTITPRPPGILPGAWAAPPLVLRGLRAPWSGARDRVQGLCGPGHTPAMRWWRRSSSRRVSVDANPRMSEVATPESEVPKARASPAIGAKRDRRRASISEVVWSAARAPLKVSTSPTKVPMSPSRTSAPIRYGMKVASTLFGAGRPPCSRSRTVRASPGLSLSSWRSTGSLVSSFPSSRSCAANSAA